MTRRQKETLDFIQAYWDTHGYCPCYDEIAAHLGIKSKSAVSRLIEALEVRGHLTRTPFRARALQIVNTCPSCGSPLSPKTEHAA